MKPLTRVIPSHDSDQAKKEQFLDGVRSSPDKFRVLLGLPPHAPMELLLTVARESMEKSAQEERWANDAYIAVVHRHASDNKENGIQLVQLSISRRDGRPARDWRDLQAMKNQLVGPECEGIELYPAESRVVDTANQSHVWVFNDPSFRIPIGWTRGVKMDAAESAMGGAMQRPFSNG